MRVFEVRFYSFDKVVNGVALLTHVIEMWVLDIIKDVGCFAQLLVQPTGSLRTAYGQPTGSLRAAFGDNRLLLLEIGKLFYVTHWVFFRGVE